MGSVYLARRLGNAGITILLIVFIVALGINLARGKPVDCGCFGTAKVQKTDAERLKDMKLVILRDVGLLLLAGQILYATKREERI